MSQLTQQEVNLILGLATLIVPTVAFIVRDWWRKRKNQITYGDNLIDAMNKTTESLKKARAEIADLDAQLIRMDDEHEVEIEEIQDRHKRESQRIKERVRILEQQLVRYDVSFTLVTHPDVKVENIAVVGREDVLSTQKIKAVQPEEKKG